MGKGTDQKIKQVRDAVEDVKSAAKEIKDVRDDINTSWGSMIKQYDKGGGVRLPTFRSILQKEAKDYRLAHDKFVKAISAAGAELDNFEKYVEEKDQRVKNPLRKKSVGKAREIILAARKELKSLDTVPDPADIDNICKTATDYYC